MTCDKSNLFATNSTVRAIIEARAVVILIGGYDGSGNYGDIAQLDAALDLVGRLGPDLLVLPLLERQYLASHLDRMKRSRWPFSHALFFDPGNNIEDSLQLVAAPRELISGPVTSTEGAILIAFGVTESLRCSVPP